jgi:3-hydroxymyristoyl/3-hydroxydecanoyl-(acyl carrier protein) dehydratase
MAPILGTVCLGTRTSLGLGSTESGELGKGSRRRRERCGLLAHLVTTPDTTHSTDSARPILSNRNNDERTCTHPGRRGREKDPPGRPRQSSKGISALEAPAKATKKRYRRALRDTLAGFKLIDSSVSTEQASLRLKLPAASPYFAGHFPGDAILPGVTQLALALQAGSLLQGGALGLSGARRVRFRRSLGPEDEIEILVTRTDVVDELHFEVRTRNATAASGTLQVTRLSDPGE